MVTGTLLLAHYILTSNSRIQRLTWYLSHTPEQVVMVVFCQLAQVLLWISLATLDIVGQLLLITQPLMATLIMLMPATAILMEALRLFYGFI